MFYCYVLKDPKSDFIYIGFSSNLKQRIKRHQEVEHPGWTLVYYEAYLDESDARQRERKLKQYGASLGHLRARIRSSMGRALERAG